MDEEDIFGETAELADSGIAATIEDTLVDLVESIVSIADRSEAHVEELEVDRVNWVARVRARVVVRNSEDAGLPNPLDPGGPNLGHFSITSTVRFNYDIQNNETSDEVLTIRTPVGADISVDIETIKAVMDGDFSKAIELIPNGGVVEREIHSDYDRIRDSYYAQHGRENVYFASARFVRWASVGTAGRWVAEAIASGGAATAAIMAEAEREAIKELDLVVEWLKTHAESEALDIATKLLTGEKIDWPFLKLVFQTVRYSSRLRLTGRVVGDEFAINRHVGFVIVWRGSPDSPDEVQPVIDDDPLADDTPDTPPRSTNQRRSIARLTLLLHD